MNHFALYLLRFLVVTLSFHGTLTWADDNSTKLKVEEDKIAGSFYAGGEFATLQTSDGALQGFGLLMGYTHLLSNRWAIDAGLSQIYGSGSGITALCSGVAAAIRWAPFAEFSRGKESVHFDGQSIVEEASLNDRVLSFGLQMNQLFLNGDYSVYNATGLAALASYDMKLFARGVRWDLRYAALTSNKKAVTGIFFDLSFLF